MKDESSNPDESQFLSFLLGNEIFGIGILKIREIIEYSDLTHVPMMPDFIPGVINLRGNVVPVIDLNARLYRKRTTIERKTCIIIVEVLIGKDKMDVGLMVDAVREVIDIPPSKIDPPPTLGAQIRVEYIYGIGKPDDTFLILLNADRILTLDDLKFIKQPNPEEALRG
jgi:purine-binding chemotaxis protein CheW